jgi:hypothetical protein
VTDDDEDPLYAGSDWWDATGKSQWREQQLEEADMGRRAKAAEQTEIGGTAERTDAAEPEPEAVEPASPAGPLSARDRLRVARRVTDAIGDLSETDQRGVIGIVALARADQADAIRKALAVLDRVAMTPEDRLAVVRIAVACVGGESPVARVGDTVSTAGFQPPYGHNPHTAAAGGGTKQYLEDRTGNQRFWPAAAGTVGGGVSGSDGAP